MTCVFFDPATKVNSWRPWRVPHPGPAFPVRALCRCWCPRWEDAHENLAELIERCGRKNYQTLCKHMDVTWIVGLSSMFHPLVRFLDLFGRDFTELVVMQMKKCRGKLLNVKKDDIATCLAGRSLILDIEKIQQNDCDNMICFRLSSQHVGAFQSLCSRLCSGPQLTCWY